MFGAYVGNHEQFYFTSYSSIYVHTYVHAHTIKYDFTHFVEKKPAVKTSTHSDTLWPILNESSMLVLIYGKLMQVIANNWCCAAVLCLRYCRWQKPINKCCKTTRQLTYVDPFPAVKSWVTREMTHVDFAYTYVLTTMIEFLRHSNNTTKVAKMSQDSFIAPSVYTQQTPL